MHITYLACWYDRPPSVNYLVFRPGSFNCNEYEIMSIIGNCNDKNIGCALLEFQLISIHSRTDVYEGDVISASILLLLLTYFYDKVDRNCIVDTGWET